MSDYSAPDHKTILADSVIQIDQMATQVKNLREDIAEMTRSLENFTKEMSRIQREISGQVTDTAIAAFNDRVEELNEKLQVSAGQRLVIPPSTAILTILIIVVPILMVLIFFMLNK